VLKVAKDAEMIMPDGKVLIFYTENEGKKGESVHFKMIDIKQEEDEEISKNDTETLSPGWNGAHPVRSI
jgi:hypothetical protein